jgi:hypothetical protein
MVTAGSVACGSSPSLPKAEPGTTPSLNTPSSAPPAPPSEPPSTEPVSVLTGLASSASGPAVVVPTLIDSGAPTPVGLDHADIASVEFAEGGSFRIVGIYSSRPDSSVGPVTMIRPSDAKVFGQTGAVFVQEGSPAGFLDTLHAAKLKYATAASGVTGFTAHGSNVYANTGEVSRSLSRGSLPPTAMFQYASSGQPVSGSGVATSEKMVVSVSGHAAITWVWNATANQWNATIGGAKASATNVVALTGVPYTKKLVSALKRNLAFADPLGSGPAKVAAGNQTITATWFKKAFASGLNLLGPDKTVAALMPGSTWILLMPAGSSVTIS